MTKNTYRDWHLPGKWYRAIVRKMGIFPPQVQHEGESVCMIFGSEGGREVKFYVDPLDALPFFMKLQRDLVLRKLLPDPLEKVIPCGSDADRIKFIRNDRFVDNNGKPFEGIPLLYQGGFILVHTQDLSDRHWREWVPLENVVK